MGRWLVLCALVGCGGDDVVMPDAAPAESFKLVHQADPASMLAVWGTSTTDVWAVGSRPATNMAGGPIVYRYDGTTWTLVDTKQASLDLWWVFGFAGGDVYFGGSGATILRYRDGQFAKMTTPRDCCTIFGIWGATANDIWAVGNGGGGGGIIWRYDGNQWNEVTPPAGTPASVFKVHGTAANNVWISAADGVILHWNGSTLEKTPSGTTAPLFSVVATSERALAAGGISGNGQLLENEGAGWQLASVVNPQRWRAVTAEGQIAYAVGEAGTAAKRSAAGWSLLPQELTQRAFHAGWVDPDGALWGVGGSFDAPPLTNGFIMYYGTQSIPEVGQ